MLKVALGQPVEVELETTSVKTKELVDPEDPFVRLLLPSGETEDVAVSKQSKGVFLLKYDPTEWGTYMLLSTGSGEWKFAVERARLFEVLKPKVPRD
jgi:hypothetical protein